MPPASPMWAMAYNVLRAAGAPASAFHAKATTTAAVMRKPKPPRP